MRLVGKKLFDYIFNNYDYFKEGRPIELGSEIKWDEKYAYLPLIRQGNLESGLLYEVEGRVSLNNWKVPVWGKVSECSEEDCNNCPDCTAYRVIRKARIPVLSGGKTIINLYLKEGDDIKIKPVGHDCRNLVYDLNMRGDVSQTKDVNMLLGSINAVLNQFSGATGLVEINQFMIQASNYFGIELSSEWRSLIRDQLTIGADYLLDHPDCLGSELLTLKTIEQLVATGAWLSSKATDYLIEHVINNNKKVYEHLGGKIGGTKDLIERLLNGNKEVIKALRNLIEFRCEVKGLNELIIPALRGNEAAYELIDLAVAYDYEIPGLYSTVLMPALNGNETAYAILAQGIIDELSVDCLEELIEPALKGNTKAYTLLDLAIHYDHKIKSLHEELVINARKGNENANLLLELFREKLREQRANS